MQKTHINIGLIETAFTSERYPLLFSGKQTDTPAFEMVGQLVYHTQDADLIKRIIISGFPANYDGNTIDQLDNKIERTLGQGWHEEKSVNGPPSTVDNLMTLMEENDCRLFHDAFKRTYITVNDNRVRRTYPLGSTAAKRYLQHLYYLEYRKPMNSQNFKLACDMLEAKALFEGETEKIYLRVAGDMGRVFINLANDKAEVVEIDKNGYRISTDSTVTFVTSPSMSAMPNPKKVDNALDRFKDLLGLDDKRYARVLGFITGALNPLGPYLCLLVEGEQGSGKSFLTECIKTIIDPSLAMKMRLPDNERDLMIMARSTHGMLFDNVSGIKGDISDALCTLSTGGGRMTRKLYTDDEMAIFNEIRPFILNGIAAYATRPDLLDRSLSLSLEAMPEEKRRGEHYMREEFETLLPGIMHELFEIISCALRNFETTEEPKGVRMTDAARFLVAAEPATNLESGSMLSALKESQKEIIAESLSKNSLAMAIITFVENRKRFSGKMNDLLRKLTTEGEVDRYFPKTAAHLSRDLSRLKPALNKVGIIVDFQPRTNTGRNIELYASDDFETGEIVSDVDTTPVRGIPRPLKSSIKM